MGTSRTCGAPCHKAKQAKCVCWCGGLFHGAAAQGAREAFSREWGGDVPTEEPKDGGGLLWERAIKAALVARVAGAAATPEP